MNSKAETILDVVGRGPVHPFPARMAPGIALKAVSKHRRPLRILDPMAGSGTVLAVARAHGHRAIGLDLDPLAVLISRVWTVPVDHQSMKMKAKEILEKAKKRFKNISQREAYPRHADEATRKFVRYWFDGHARRQLCALAEVVAGVRSKKSRDVLWCAFSRMIITKQSGASLAMDVSHSRPHKSFNRAPSKPFRMFLVAVDRVIDNTIEKNARQRGPATKVYEADARNAPVANSSIDLVLTSPPYLNAIDYMRCSKFSLVWMGYSVKYLGSLRALSVGTEVGAGEKFLTKDARDIIGKLGLASRLSSRHQAVLARYINDMTLAMAEVARVLVPGGLAMFVVGENTVRGTYIKTADILVAVAKRIGLRSVSRRSRILPANRRYLPPPGPRETNRLQLRMRREIIISFRKSKRRPPKSLIKASNDGVETHPGRLVLRGSALTRRAPQDEAGRSWRARTRRSQRI